MKIEDIGMRMDELADELDCPELAGLAEALAEYLDRDAGVVLSNEGLSINGMMISSTSSANNMSYTGLTSGPSTGRVVP